MQRGFVKFSQLLIILLAAAAAGCSTVNVAHRDALRDAEAAKQRGDLIGAAHAYRAACNAQPGDKKSCDAATWYARLAVDARLAAARPYCEPNSIDGKPATIDVARCLAELAPARPLLPDDPEVLRLVNGAGRAHANACLALPLTKAEEAVQLARCMLSMRAEVATAAYEKMWRSTTARAAAVFVDLAALGTTRDKPGAQLVLWSAAACLDPDGEVRRRVELARRDFLAASAIPLTMTLNVNGPGNAAGSPALLGICSRTVETLGPRAVCRPARTEVAPAPTAAVTVDALAVLRAPLALGVNLRISAPEHRISEERRSVRWQSGVNRFTNPRFQAVRDDVAAAEQAFRDMEQEVLERDGRCKTARAALERTNNCTGCGEREAADLACNDFDSANTVLARRRQELSDKRSELANTPPVLEEPVFQEESYVVRKHQFIARWVADLALAGGATQQASGAFTAEDEEHLGVPEAGLGADPFSPPPSGFYEADVAKVVAEQAAALASGDLARRAAMRRGECVGDAPVWTGAWLSCWAESTLWSGSLPEGLVLLVEAAHAADRFRNGGSSLPAPVCVQ